MRRLLAQLGTVIISVGIGVCFLTSVLTFNDSLWKTAEDSVSQTFADYTYVVSASGPVADHNPINQQLADKIRASSGVEKVEPSIDSIGFVKRGTLTDPIRLRSLDWLKGGASIVAGQAPDKPNQVLLDASIASDWGYTVGDTVAIEESPEDPEPAQVESSGLVKAADSLLPGAHNVIYGTVETLNTVRGVTDASYSRLLVQAPASEQMLQSLQTADSAAAHPLIVNTVDEFAGWVSYNALPGTEYLQMGIIAVAAVAFLVLILVIRSVFTVRVEQDRRDYSLRRCIGASRGQIFSSVLFSAAGAGILGSLLGLALSLAATAALLSLPFIPLIFEVKAASILWAFLAGIAVCVVGALGPARLAMKNTPLGALRESATVDGAQPASLGWPLILKSTLFVLVAALLALVSYTGILIGSILLAIILLILGLSLLPTLTQISAKLLLRLVGSRPWLAVRESLERVATHSQRTASISGLTAITVVFIALIGTGSATALASLNKAFTDVPLPDVVVSLDEGKVSAEHLAQIIESLPKVKGVALAQIQRIDLVGDGNEVDGAKAVTNLSEALSGYPVSYQGVSQQASELESYLNLLRSFALMLLAVGILIALIGVSNTLRVSIIERTQEIGLQRALGAQESQVRLWLVLEAVFLTGLGAILGLIGGSVLATSTVYSLTQASQGMRFGLDIPWVFLGASLLATLLVGVVASLLASRLARRISPVQAIVSQ